MLVPLSYDSDFHAYSVQDDGEQISLKPGDETSRQMTLTLWIIVCVSQLEIVLGKKEVK